MRMLVAMDRVRYVFLLLCGVCVMLTPHAPLLAAPSPTETTAMINPNATQTGMSGSITVSIPRAATRFIPDFLRLLASHTDSTYQSDTLVKEWGLSNSTLEVRTYPAVICARGVR